MKMLKYCLLVGIVFLVSYYELDGARGNLLDELSQLPYTFPSYRDQRFVGKFAMPFLIDYSVATKGYDLGSLEVPLSRTIFKRNFGFRDIFLFSNLCEQDKVHIVNMTPPPLGDRKDNIGVNLPFGAYKNDLYPMLLAPTQVNIGASQAEMQIVLSIIRQGFDVWGGIKGLFGISIPVKYKSYTMDLSFCGGQLLRQVFSPTGTVRENSMYQFFKDYESMYDFFVRAILDCKGLIFDQNQKKFGFGDIILFLAGEFAYLSKHIDSWQIGVDLACPTGGKYKGDKVWELVLGNGGAWQLEAFTNLIMKTPMWFVNPVMRGALQMSFPFTARHRLPRRITNEVATQVANVQGLLAPVTFDKYWVEPFDELDASVPWFTDTAPYTRNQWGNRVVFGLGNFIYDWFSQRSRLGFFYDFVYNAHDKFSVIPIFGISQAYDPSHLMAASKKKIHRLSWNWSYLFSTGNQITIGSQHVVSGYNSAKLSDVFVIWTMVF